MSDDLQGPGTVSIKFGKGYEAPLFVARGTVQEMGLQLIEAFGLKPARDATLADITAEASAVAGGLQKAHQPVENGGLGGTPVAQPAPATQGWGDAQRPANDGNVQQGPPQGGQGEGPGGNCPHGARTWKQGVGKTKQDGTPGKPYKGWFCPQSARDCTPVWG